MCSYDVLPHVFCYSRLLLNPLTLVTQVYISLYSSDYLGSMRPANGWIQCGPMLVDLEIHFSEYS